MLHDSSIIDNFLHILLVDVAHASAGLVAVTPGHRQVALGEIGRSSNLVGASTVALLCGQHVIGSLEVGNDLLHQLVMRELIVGCLFLAVVLIDFLVDPGYLVPQLYELEVEVGTEEAYLTFADSPC